MDAYPFESITVNGRAVALSAIMADKAVAATDFERDTFNFIRQWHNGTNTFTLHTSGSTGAPKEISFTRRQLVQSAAATISALRLLPGNTALVCLPTRYIAGKMMLVRAFTNHMKIVAVEPSSDPWPALAADATVDFAAFVPLQVEHGLRHGRATRLNAIKTILIGGAPVSPDLHKNITATLKTGIYATYGMTETLSHVALCDLRHPTGVFKTLPGIQIALDHRGCLVITCPYLDNPVITNDLAVLTGPDTFIWQGRADNIINSGGIKVIPETIEAQIALIFARMDLNRRFFVAGIPDQVLGSRVILCVEGDPLAAAIETTVLAHLKTALPGQILPRSIVSIKRFRSTETGKISRNTTLKYLPKNR